MKCTNCGKNNAVCHYHFEENGKVTEAHLCADCARKLAPEREFASRTRDMFAGMFPDDLFGGSLLSDGFFGGSLLGDGSFGGSQPADGFFGGAVPTVRRGFLDGDPFEGFFGRGFLSPFAGFGVPRIEISFPDAAAQPAAGAESAADQSTDPELAKKRRINQLRQQMQAAAASEDYEQAARLRDQLKNLEAGDK